jgi:hypothetical protein
MDAETLGRLVMTIVLAGCSGDSGTDSDPFPAFDYSALVGYWYGDSMQVAAQVGRRVLPIRSSPLGCDQCVTLGYANPAVEWDSVRSVFDQAIMVAPTTSARWTRFASREDGRRAGTPSSCGCAPAVAATSRTGCSTGRKTADGSDRKPIGLNGKDQFGRPVQSQTCLLTGRRFALVCRPISDLYEILRIVVLRECGPEIPTQGQPSAQSVEASCDGLRGNGPKSSHQTLHNRGARGNLYGRASIYNGPPKIAMLPCPTC